MLGNTIGGLLILEAVFMVIPLITTLIYEEKDWEAFGFTAAFTALSGILMRRIPVRSNRMGKREGFILTASVWIFFSLFGMIPFIISSTPVSASSAFFEAMSAFTTTGATSVTIPITELSHGIIIWQALMQWLGGMGIIIFTLAVVPALNNSGGMLMFNAEATGVIHDKIRPRISQTAMTLWGMYLILTLILVSLLWIGPMDLFDSICHAFGTISTGGYSNKAQSVAEFGSNYVLGVICIFMFLSGINFALLYKTIFLQNWQRFRNDDVIKAYIGIIVVFSILFAVGQLIKTGYTSFTDIAFYSVFQVVSTLTSTGYLAPGFFMWEPFILALVFVMMFCGGCAGSTSGGAKIDRVIYLKRFIDNELHHCIHPNSVLSVRYNGKIVSPDIVRKTIAFLCIFMILVVSGGTALSFLGLPPVDSFFSSLSCLCNTGIGASITGYGDDFATMPDLAKWIMSFLMLIGRLEIYTVLLLFTPSFWK